MKKILSIILLVCLVISTQAYAYTIVDNGKEEANKSLDINEFFYTNDSCYYYLYPNLYKYDSSEDKFVFVAKSEDDSIKQGINSKSPYFAGADDIYTCSKDAIYKANIEGDRISYSKVVDIKNTWDTHTQIAVSGNALYYTNLGFGYVYAVNMLTGAEAKVTNNDRDYYRNICRYKDGVIAINEHSHSIDYISGKTITKLYNLDNSDVFSLAYDSEKDVIYALSDNNIYSINAKGEIDRRILENNCSRVIFTDSLFVFGKNLAKTINFSGIAKDKNPIKVAGLIDSGTLDKYNQEHPNNLAVRYSLENDRDSLIKNMFSKDEADVYFTELHYGIDSIYEHGLIEPLNKYENLKNNLDKLYPYIKNAISKDDQYYFMPFNVYSYCLEVDIRPFIINKALWNKLGLKDSQIPKNYMELLDFLSYVLDNADKFNNISIIESPTINDFAIKLKLRIINQESLLAKLQNRKPVYSSNEILNFFNGVDKLVDRIIKDEASINLFSYSPYGEYLFERSSDILSMPAGFEYMPLCIRDGDPCPILAGATVAFINSYSNKKAESAEFLNYYIEHFDDRKKNYFYEDANINYRDQEQEELIKELNKTLENEKELLASLKDKKNIETQSESIKTLEEKIKIEESRVMKFSTEGLSILKNNTDNIVILQDNLVNTYNNDFQELLEKFYPYNVGDDQLLDNKSFLEKLDELYK